MIKLAFLTLGALVAASGSVMAADLPTHVAAAVAAPAAPASNWDGPYVGAFVGYGWGTLDASNITAGGVGAPAIVSTSVPTDGFQVGVRGGYNFHLSDTIVAGVSADFAYDNGNGSAHIPNTVDVFLDTQMNWIGSVTGRLGVDVNGVVPYVLGGVAFANGSGTVVNGGVSGASQSQTFTGYTVGAGAEFSLADNVSLDAEYRYTNYGSQNFSSLGAVTVPAGALSSNSVRVGLNYHF